MTSLFLRIRRKRCIVSVFERAFDLLPGLNSFMADFETQVRMGIIDRFSANLRSERHLKSWAPKNSIAVEFTCDVHKEASCVKAGTALSDNTLSGLVNLALAMSNAGSLDGIRTCLQEIFEEELVISRTPPPDENSHQYQHRLAVLKLFLPITGRKSKQRRYIIQSLANSDVQSSDIVHHCAFDATYEQILKVFKKHLTPALLPCKLPILNRKSWTGASEAVQWAGLMESHWHLLPRVILRFIRIDRPISNWEDYQETSDLFMPLMALSSGDGFLGEADDDPNLDTTADDVNRLFEERLVAWGPGFLDFRLDSRTLDSSQCSQDLKV